MAGRPATLKIDILTDASKATRGMDGVGKSVGKMGAAVAAGALLAGAAVVGLAVKAVGAASDVQQAYGATDSIFGKYAAGVKKSAEAAATSLGLSKSSYADLANVLGAQLKNAGTSMDKLGPKTGKLIGLGSDLAATFGGTTADAVQAVSSLLKGEADPIEKYGVSIKKSDINARLAAQGLGKLTGSALKQAEATAALDLLYKQTSSSVGAFGRESDTLAGQQARLGALWENLQATIGAALLPMLTSLGTYFTTTLLPTMDRLWSQLKVKLAPAFAALALFVKTSVIPAVRSFAPILAAVGKVITGTVIPAAAAFATWFFTKIAPNISRVLTPILAGLRAAFASVQAAVARNQAPIAQVAAVLRTLFGAAKTVYEFYARYLAPFLGRVLGAAFKALGFVIGSVIDTMGRAVTGAAKVFSMFKALAGFMGPKLRPAFEVVASVVRGVAGAFGTAWDRVQSLWALLQRVAAWLRNSTLGKLLASVGGAISKANASGITASSLVSSRLTAADPGFAFGLVPSVVQVGAPVVLVRIGERELYATIDDRVDTGTRRLARRLAGGVR